LSHGFGSIPFQGRLLFLRVVTLLRNDLPDRGGVQSRQRTTLTVDRIGPPGGRSSFHTQSVFCLRAFPLRPTNERLDQTGPHQHRSGMSGPRIGLRTPTSAIIGPLRGDTPGLEQLRGSLSGRWFIFCVRPSTCGTTARYPRPHLNVSGQKEDGQPTDERPELGWPSLAALRGAVARRVLKPR
jgi:hypothetical protein